MVRKNGKRREIHSLIALIDNASAIALVQIFAQQVQHRPDHNHYAERLLQLRCVG
jgi:hypothetical protein